MNGGLHIKQENLLTQELHLQRESEQMHHVIKREMNAEFEDVDQEQQQESIAEDLTMSQDHNESNIINA